MPKSLKDPRLWIQSGLVMGVTVLASLALNGALATPTALGDPQPHLTSVSPSESPYKALANHQE